MHRSSISSQPPLRGRGAPTIGYAPAEFSTGSVDAPGTYGSVRAAVREARLSLTLIGVLLYAFAIYTYALPVGFLGIAIAAAGFVIAGPRFPMPAVLFSCFTAWAAISSLSSPYKASGEDPWVTLAKVVIIFMLAVNAVRTRAQARVLVLALLFFFCAWPARGAIINYLSGYRVFGRALWNRSFGNPNDLAAYAILTLGLGTAVFLGARDRLTRLMAIGALLILPTVILMTQSRAAFIGLALALVLFIAGQRRNRTKMIFWTSMLLVAAGLLAPRGVWERVAGLSSLTSAETAREADAEGSAGERLEIWKTGWRVIADNGAIGVGIGRYPIYNGQYSPKLGVRDMHSTYFTVMAETGYLGFALWLAAVLAVLLRARKAAARIDPLFPSAAVELRLISLGVIGFMVAGIWGSFGYSGLFLLTLALLWSLSTITLGEAKRAGAVAAALPTPDSPAHRLG